MKDHFILCGYGRVGAAVARELAHAGQAVTVVDTDESSREQAISDGHLAVRGDATDDGTLEAAGVREVRVYDNDYAPGMGIHEMGTARMGRDSKTSVLNAHNQVWDCPNVFVTDGACMTSSACQNPSLTYMALTARAAAYAVEELKRGNL